jgi:SAM-dependent methyltransferase
MPTLLKKIVLQLRAAVDVSRNALGLTQSQSRLVADAQAWWQAPPNHKQGPYSHWRSSFSDADWLLIGKPVRSLYESFARSTGFQGPARRIVEWGCGGGAIAVHFKDDAHEYFGVDISQASLDEADKQMKSFGATCFKPVLADAAKPTLVRQALTGEVDLFLSVYVFEAFPTPAYGVEVLKVAASLLRTGGMAIIQIKYPTNWSNRSRGWGYKFGVANMTSYPIDEFWKLTQEAGFQPQAVFLEPWVKTVSDGRYAYFVLMK